MRKQIAPLTLLLAISPAIAADFVPLKLEMLDGKVHPKEWQRIKVKPNEARQFVEFKQDVELACQPESTQSLHRKLAVPKNVYPVEQKLHNKKGLGEWIIIPAISDQNVQFGYNNSAGRTSGYEHYVALNPDSLAVFPREVVAYTQEWSRLDRSRWSENVWTFGCTPTTSSASSQPVVRMATEREFVAAQDGQVRQFVLGALDQALQRKEVIERERPLKSEIGAAVCKLNGAVLLQGFTEKRSPDNDKIQIRIWRASFSENGRPSAAMPSEFHEFAIWDNPDNWELCRH